MDTKKQRNIDSNDLDGRFGFPPSKDTTFTFFYQSKEAT